MQRTSNALDAVLERLSSGKRINRASDDAAGLAISESLNTDARVYNQAIRNINDGISALNIADGAVQELDRILVRQRELAEQAANGIYSATQREALNLEANSLVDEFNRIIETAQFNNRSLLGTDTTSMAIQAGYGTDNSLQVNYLEREGLFGTGVYTDITSTYSSATISTQAYFARDLDSDGFDDIVLLRAYASGTSSLTGTIEARVFRGNAAGTFAPSSITSINATTGATITSFNLSGQYAPGSGDQYDVNVRVGFGLTPVDFTISGNGASSISIASGGSAPGVNDFSSVTGTLDYNGDGVEDRIGFFSSSAMELQLQQTEYKKDVVDLRLDPLNLSTQASALNALDTLDESFSELTTVKGTLGAIQSRLQSALGVVSTRSQEYQAASARIVDADIAEESAKLISKQILMQASAAVLAQANQSSELALSLLRAPP